MPSGASSRPPGPNRTPVIITRMLCLVRLQVDSAGLHAVLGETLGWFGKLGWLRRGKTLIPGRWIEPLITYPS